MNDQPNKSYPEKFRDMTEGQLEALGAHQEYYVETSQEKKWGDSWIAHAATLEA